MLEPCIVLERKHACRTDVRLDTSLEMLLERAPDTQAQVLATVVTTAGSTYRKPGARMLIMGDGSFIGLLSGGCLESDLMLHAREVMHTQVPRAVEYDMRGPDDELFGIGAGCEGAMRVLLEPCGPNSSAAAALKAAGAATAEGRPTALILIHDSAAALGTYHVAGTAGLPPRLNEAAAHSLREGASRNIEWQDVKQRERAFVQFLAPLPHLLILGAGPDAQPVVAGARGLGWRVTVMDHRPAYAVAARFPGARVICADPVKLRSAVAIDSCHAAVVMSHHLKSDEAYLRELAAAGAPGYVGLLGPSARRLRLANELGVVYEQLRSRLQGPVGIDIGAKTPEAIALSIVSQIHGHLAGKGV